MTRTLGESNFGWAGTIHIFHEFIVQASGALTRIVASVGSVTEERETVRVPIGMAAPSGRLTGPSFPSPINFPSDALISHCGETLEIGFSKKFTNSSLAERVSSDV